jgi:hypothetical protein
MPTGKLHIIYEFRELVSRLRHSQALRIEPLRSRCLSIRLTSLTYLIAFTPPRSGLLRTSVVGLQCSIYNVGSDSEPGDSQVACALLRGFVADSGDRIASQT